jgi:hypothetical protein
MALFPATGDVREEVSLGLPRMIGSLNSSFCDFRGLPIGPLPRSGRWTETRTSRYSAIAS